MPDPLHVILILLCEIAKENQTGPVRCPCCHRSVCFIKYGFYERYLFNSAERIKVQRYRCKNPRCDLVTYSILPHPFLRYTRFPLCFFTALLSAHETDHRSISSLARCLNLSRGIIRRSLSRAWELRRWLSEVWREESAWSQPCLNPRERWTDFIRVFSWAFYPGRYGTFGANTI